jgi:hypothetical protein
MPGQSLLIPVLLISATVFGCASASQNNPFLIARERFAQEITTIAIAPVYVPPGLTVPTHVSTRILGLIEVKLQEVGYKVIPWQVVSEVQKSLIAQMGGLFDPYTGQVNKSKSKAFFEKSQQELIASHGADGFIYAEIRLLSASFFEGVANWDGVSDQIAITGNKESRIGPLQGLVRRQANGNIAALSTEIFIRNKTNALVYKNRGGIQVIQSLAYTDSGPKLQLIPNNELFSNVGRVIQAVNIAMDPLVQLKKPSAPAEPVSSLESQ